MFQPVQRWVGGGIYTPNLITLFQKCPSGPHKGQEITSGVFGNFPRSDSPTWILLLGSRVSCPSGTFGSSLRAVVGTFGFCDVRQPSVTTFDKLRGTSPFSSVTFALPEASRRFRASPSDAGPRRALQCFVIFGEPSGILRVTPPSREGDCPTLSIAEAPYRCNKLGKATDH